MSALLKEERRVLYPRSGVFGCGGGLLAQDGDLMSTILRDRLPSSSSTSALQRFFFMIVEGEVRKEAFM